MQFRLAGSIQVLDESGIEARTADPRFVSIQELWDGGFSISRAKMCSNCYALRQRRVRDLNGPRVPLRDARGLAIRNARKAMGLYTAKVRAVGVWFNYSSFGLEGGVIRFEERTQRHCEVTLQHFYGFEGTAWFLFILIDGGSSGAWTNGRLESELLAKTERQLTDILKNTTPAISSDPPKPQ